MNTIMYFSADWCAPCKAMKPMIDDFIKDNPEPKIFKIDADIESELVKKFEVRGIPTFVMLNEGEEVKRHTGSMTKEQWYDFVNYEEISKDDV